MGLDQYAYFVKRGEIIDDFSFEEDGETQEAFYWRKNRHLHGWMEELFRKKGGEGEFNCQPVRLKKKDLNELKKVIKKRSFNDAHGYFWGDRKYDDAQAENDLEFVQEAKHWIDKGGAVYYSSWW